MVEPQPGEGPALSRRKLLALAGAAGAGAFIAACGGGGGGGGGSTAGPAGGGHGGLEGTISVIQPEGTAASPDVAILNRALALEHRAVATYAAVIPRLGGEEKANATIFSGQEQEHVAVLEDAVRALGAIPAARPRPDYELPRLKTGEQALALAISLEDLLLAAHLESLPKLSSPDLRGTFASILTVEAEHATVLSGRSEALPKGDLGGGAVSDLSELIFAQAAVVGEARKAQLPDELRDLPKQAQARLAALVAVDPSNAETPVASGSPLHAALGNAIGAAYAAVQKIDDAQTLRVVAQVMAGNGQSLALLRQSMNQKPVPSAFETGKAP